MIMGGIPFYLSLLKPELSYNDNIDNPNTLDNPSRKSWAGFTFEQVCKDHIVNIKKAGYLIMHTSPDELTWISYNYK